MEIVYLGCSCFLVRGKKTTLIADPYSPESGLKLPQTSAEIITISHDHSHHNYPAGIQSKTRPEPFIVNGPGEYEISGVSIFGILSYHDDSQGKKAGKNTLYVITMDELRIAHLGDLGHLLNDEQQEEVNGVDLVLIPVGGPPTLGPAQAVAVISQIEPKIIVPMHYRLPGLKMKLAPVEDFLKEIGRRETKPIGKLTVSKEKLPEAQEVVVLNARS